MLKVLHKYYPVGYHVNTFLVFILSYSLVYLEMCFVWIEVIVYQFYKGNILAFGKVRRVHNFLALWATFVIMIEKFAIISCENIAK